MGISTVLDTQVLATSGADGDVLTQQADGTYLAETPSAGGSPGGSTGEIQYNDAGAFGGTVALVYAASGTHFTVTAQAATDVPVVVKGAVSQTANLIEVNSSSGSGGNLFRIASGGHLYVNSALAISPQMFGAKYGSGDSYILVQNQNTNSNRVVIKGDNTWLVTGDANSRVPNEIRMGFGAPANPLRSTSGTIVFDAVLGKISSYLSRVTAQTATDVPVVVMAAASQTGNIHEWHDSASAVHGTVSENGYFTTRKVAAPVDAELSASEVAYWFDATDGAGKLMIKGKTANGTVVTGEVALS